MSRYERNQSAEDFQHYEWRNRPRADRRGKRSARLNVRVSPNEYWAIVELAELSGMTFSDYIVCQCLKIEKRVLSG